jgi:hypothetical protein
MTTGPLGDENAGVTEGEGRGPAPEVDEEFGLLEAAGLFEGDEGSLRVSQRNAVIALLKKEFISSRTDAAEWKAVLESPAAIRRVLHELFLDLVLDRERGVAYKRQVKSPAGGTGYSTLLYDRRWSREETIVLVLLRTRHRAERLGGSERAYIDRQDILDQVAEYRPASATDISGAAGRAEKAVESICRTGLLVGPKTGERFEISEAIEVLMPMPRLKELLAWLHAQQDRPADEGSVAQGAIADAYPAAFADEDLLEELIGLEIEFDPTQGHTPLAATSASEYDLSGDAA